MLCEDQGLECCFYQPGNTKGCWQATISLERFPLKVSDGSCPCRQHDFGLLIPQTVRQQIFCNLKTMSFWYFVKVALGNNTKIICCLSTSLHTHAHTHLHTCTLPNKNHSNNKSNKAGIASKLLIKFIPMSVLSDQLFLKSLGGDCKQDVEIQMFLTMCCVCVQAQSLQLCLTLCDFMDCNLSGSSIHGILQARILERVAMTSSRGSCQLRDWTHILYIAEWFFTSELGKFLLTNTSIQKLGSFDYFARHWYQLIKLLIW